MKLEILLSCMNQTDWSLSDQLNCKTDILIISQGQSNGYAETTVDGHRRRMICITQKGLANSRNLALAAAMGDIGLLCDDDVSYCDDYEQIILKAFGEMPDAAVIAFNIDSDNRRNQTASIRKKRRAPHFKSYSSVRLAFRIELLRRNGVFFNTSFGAGSLYGSGEETIFLNEARRKGLRIYEYPATIATVDFSDSSWFEGFTEKYFFDKGALLAAAWPGLKHLFILYFIRTHRQRTSLSTLQIIRSMRAGIRDYAQRRCRICQK